MYKIRTYYVCSGHVMALVQLLMVDFVDHFVVCPLNALDTADPRNLQPGDPYLTVSKLVDTKGSSLISLVLIIEPFFSGFHISIWRQC